ncbi:hypothetical protein [Pedobacter sp. BMA]|uniref:hypothetical protein n=1 Tax=Pedobacter sp. BMA TaxID=1663685 RepID=UPI00064B6B27|nr:hypothetical protein [Pedobacter sp. BMA]KLT63792.1 hypothetical protein AB669_20340 [Pedobacter sp. BMA]
MLLNDNIPTSLLLDVKPGDEITSAEISGVVHKIEIQETDDFLLFIFILEDKQELAIKKLRQVC